MKAYKVKMGYEKDWYGYQTNNAIEKFFFNKDKAIELYKKGEWTEKVCVIYTTYSDGHIGSTTVEIGSFEKYAKLARKNQRVVIENKIYNKYTFEEIEIL